MTSPYSFATDSKLPPALARKMQAHADHRAERGLISPDGQVHISAECRDVYDAGHGLLSRAYAEASTRYHVSRTASR